MYSRWKSQVYTTTECGVTPCSKSDVHITPIFGPLAFFIFLFMDFCTHWTIRRYFYEWFRASHYLYFAGMAVLYFHLNDFGAPLIFPFILHVGDLILRWYRSLREVEVIEATANVDTNLVHLTLKAPHIKVIPGGYCFLNVWSVSCWQYHPFSISSNSISSSNTEDDENYNGIINFDIKNMQNNKFTNTLFDQILKSETPSEELKVHLDGSYGKLPFELTDFKKVVLFAGGIGVTPMSSILEYLASLRTYGTEKLNRIEEIHFLWTVRSAEMFSVISPTFTKIQDFMSNSENGPRIIIKLFVTRGELTETTFMENDNFQIHQGRPKVEEYLEKVKSDRDSYELKESISSQHKEGDDDKISEDKEEENKQNNSSSPDDGSSSSSSSSQSITDENVAALVCGPSKLKDDVNFSCIRLDIPCHWEEFEF